MTRPGWQATAEQKRIYRKRWRIKNHHKHMAHKAVAKAIKRGTLVKPDACEKCGDTTSQIDGAHTDYSQRLKVLWLCTSCHRIFDGRMMSSKKVVYRHAIT